MGEIGIHWKEYLYELQYWQIYLISKGYLKRHHPGWEQARLVAYNACFSMSTKTPPPITDWLSFPWEKNDVADIPDDEEIQKIRERIILENKKSEAG